MNPKQLAQLILVVLISASAYGQHKFAYKIFNKQGKTVKYQRMIKQLDGVDLVFFGENHDNSIAHWLELELVKDRFNRGKIQLGAEMFETDNQEALSDYLSGKITDKALDSLARLWKNYKTDYKPIVAFAKKHQLSFTATNIPRRYANDVYKKGGFKALDSLSDKEKKWIAPLPLDFDSELSQYKKMLTMMGGHGSIDMVKAQASKDATMAYFITKNLKIGHQFIHLNGSFHSDFHQGILWYVQRTNPRLKMATISIVEQSQLKKLDKKYLDKADFIICVDEDVTKTY